VNEPKMTENKQTRYKLLISALETYILNQADTLYCLVYYDDPSKLSRAVEVLLKNQDYMFKEIIRAAELIRALREADNDRLEMQTNIRDIALGIKHLVHQKDRESVTEFATLLEKAAGGK
jgi:hypothetical protein